MAKYYYDKFTAIATRPKVIQETRGASLEKVSSDLIVKDYLGMLLPGTAIFDSIFLSAEIYNDGISLQGNGGDFTKYPKLYQIYHSGLGGSSDSGEQSFYFYGKYGSTFEFYRMRIVYSSVDYSYKRELFRLDIVEGPTTTYSKGALLQANVVAEDNTYPTNGRHTDGFWYVKGVAAVKLPGTLDIESVSIGLGTSRKLRVLDNGWLVAAAIKTASRRRVTWYVSKDNGITWNDLCYTTISTADISGVAIATWGNQVFSILTTVNGSVALYKFDATTQGYFDIGVIKNLGISFSVALYPCIEIDPLNGRLHVAFVGKSTTSYTKSQNIIYTTSPDFGVNWATQVFLTGLDMDNSNVSNVSMAWVKNRVYPVVTFYATVNFTFGVFCVYHNGSSWIQVPVHTSSTPSLGITNPSVVSDNSGVLHMTWQAMPEVGMPHQIWYAKSLDGGATWINKKTLTNWTSESTFPVITVDKNNTLCILISTRGPSSMSFYYIMQIRSLDNGDTWNFTTAALNEGANLYHPGGLYDPKFKVLFKPTAPFIYQMPSLQFSGGIVANSAPTIAVSIENNLTLYENDTINISGSAYDADKDQSVTVFYQINSEPRKVLATNVSQTQIALSKQLMFKDGKLYDGETVLTGKLTEGVAHILKFWAVDSENAQSTTVERTFYVVPNRAPLLSIDAVVPSGVVDADNFKINGTASDEDANSNVKVTRKINGGDPVEIYSGQGGAWEFDVSLAQLVVGENTIVIEVIDNHNAKTSKTIKLKKNEVKTPILHSVARYKITPPAGSAKGVLLFVERDEEMDLKVEISMTLTGEQEQYETLTADNTAPMPNTNGIVEDTYYYEATEPKDNIILKLSTTRPDATVNHKIHLISGAVE